MVKLGSKYSIYEDIMAEQAGPSGAGSALLGRSVEETKELFETGVECIRVRCLHHWMFMQVLLD